MTKILIVEDNEMNRDMLSRRLERKGYEIEIAVDGEEGLSMMRNNKPDLVLMDMGLPVLDGGKQPLKRKRIPPSRSYYCVDRSRYGRRPASFGSWSG